MSTSWLYTSCSDHSCIWGHPGGVGTNGGCSHLSASRAEMRHILMAMGQALEQTRPTTERKTLEEVFFPEWCSGCRAERKDDRTYDHRQSCPLLDTE